MNDNYPIEYEYVEGSGGEGFAISDDLLTLYGDDGEPVGDMSLRRAFYILKNWNSEYNNDYK